MISWNKVPEKERRMEKFDHLILHNISAKLDVKDFFNFCITSKFHNNVYQKDIIWTHYLSQIDEEYNGEILELKNNQNVLK